MKNEITWKTVYDIWMEYVSKLQINLEVNIVNVEVDIDTNGIEVDWISKEVYDAVQNQKNKERLKLNKTTTNGVQQTIKCIREAQNNFEHLSFLWIRAFLHEVKRKKKFQTAEETILIQKLDAIIKQQQNKFKIAEYQNNMDSVLPGYLFSQVLVNEVHIVKLENFIEMCALNTLYITNQYYFVRYIKKSEISEQQKELFQSIAEYWHTHGNLEHTSVTYEDATERCWCCGMNKKLYPTYIIPKELKGEYKPNNLILLCGTCKRSAPQVYNPYSMWQWLQGHKIRFFDHYRIEEAAKEYELMYQREINTDFQRVFQLYGDPLYFDYDYKKLFSRKKRRLTSMGILELSPSTWAVLQYETMYELMQKMNLHHPSFEGTIQYNDFKGEYYIELPKRILDYYNGREIHAKLKIENNEYHGSVSNLNGRYYFNFYSATPLKSIGHSMEMNIEEIFY